MDRVKVYLLHGFLGRPDDWNFLTSHMSSSNVEFSVLDYFADSPLTPEHTLEEFGHYLNEQVRRDEAEHNILIGYSLGGRLALQALADDPALWTKAIFLSTNPGLRTQEEKNERAISDAAWAERFRTEKWEELMAAWNSQGVLKDSQEPERFEKNYRRQFLVECLNRWSLSQQKDARSVIREHAEKISWIVGENDIKFLEIANELKKENPALDLQTINQASHRVFFDQPDVCARLLEGKIKKAANL